MARDNEREIRTGNAEIEMTSSSTPKNLTTEVQAPSDEKNIHWEYYKTLTAFIFSDNYLARSFIFFLLAAYVNSSPTYLRAYGVTSTLRSFLGACLAPLFCINISGSVFAGNIRFLEKIISDLSEKNITQLTTDIKKVEEIFFPKECFDLISNLESEQELAEDKIYIALENGQLRYRTHCSSDNTNTVINDNDLESFEIDNEKRILISGLINSSTSSEELLASIGEHQAIIIEIIKKREHLPHELTQILTTIEEIKQLASTIIANTNDSEAFNQLSIKLTDSFLLPQRQKIADLHRNGFWTFTVLSVPVLLFMLFPKDPLLAAGENEEVASIVQNLLRLEAPTMLFTLWWMNALQITGSFNATPMFIGPTTMIAEVALGICLSKGYGGLPALGLKAIPLIFDAESLVNALYFNYKIYYDKDFKDLKLLQNIFRFDDNFRSSIWNQLKDGLAITVTYTAEMIFLFSLTLLANHYLSKNALSAWTIILPLIGCNTLFSINGAVVAAIMLGWSLLKGKEQAEYAATWALRHTLLVSAILPLICTAYPKILMSLSNNEDPEVLHHLENLMYYGMTAGMIGEGYAYPRQLEVRVRGDRWTSSQIRVSSIIFSFALCAALLALTNLKENAIGISFLVQALLTCTRLENLYQSKLGQPTFSQRISSAVCDFSSVFCTQKNNPRTITPINVLTGP